MDSHHLNHALSCYSKIIGWGSGAYARRLLAVIPFAYLVDNNSEVWHTNIDDIAIYPPEQLAQEDPATTLILICSDAYAAIAKTLQETSHFAYFPGQEFYDFYRCTLPLNDHFTPSQHVITISRTNYTREVGGTCRYLTQQTQTFQEHEIACYHCFWRNVRLQKQCYRIYFILKDGQPDRYQSESALIASGLIATARTILIHNLIGLDYSGLYAILQHDRQTLFYYLHDYGMVCSNITLLKNHQHYCGVFELGKDVCRDCRYQSEQHQVELVHRQLLQQFTVVFIAPAPLIAQQISQYYHKNDQPVTIEIIPHLRYRQRVIAASRPATRIAFLGWPSAHKGWSEFAWLARQQIVGYDFYHLGCGETVDCNIQYQYVNFIEQGVHAMRYALQHHRIDMVFLWSRWPETYCFTYYESLEAGCFVITHRDSGNIAASIQQQGGGMIFDDIHTCAQALATRFSLNQCHINSRTVIDQVCFNTDFITRCYEKAQ
jgi:hypothetical protein